MADPRFFRRVGPFRLEDVAAKVGAELLDPSAKDTMICDIASLDTAGPGELSFFNHAQHLNAFRATQASAVVTTRDFARNGPSGVHLMSVEQPQLAFARIGLLYYPSDRPEPEISVDARIDPSAVIGRASRIDAGAIVGAGAEVGGGCHIACHAVIGGGVVLGNDSAVGANSCISHAIIGARVRIASGVSIGGQGFGFVPAGNGRLRIPQLGRVIIEDDVEIGANCAIDRGSTGDTVIGAGTVLDNLVHIAHNVRIGRCCVICGQVGIAGSTVVGDGVMMGGRSASATICMLALAHVSPVRAGSSATLRNGKPSAAIRPCPYASGTGRRQPESAFPGGDRAALPVESAASRHARGNRCSPRYAERISQSFSMICIRRLIRAGAAYRTELPTRQT